MPLAAPANLHVSGAIGSTSVPLAWNSVATASGYEVSVVPTAAGSPPVSTLTDTFSGALNTSLWPTNSGAVVGGQRCALPIATASGSAFISTDPNLYNLTNSAVYVELAARPTAATSSTYLMVIASYSPEQKYAIMREAGNLIMREVSTPSGSAVVSDTSLPYDETMHRWLRIRHDGTNICWDTSNNGKIWTNRRSKVPAFSVASVIVMLEALWQTTVGVGRAEYAHLNVPSAAVSNPATAPPYYFGSLVTQQSQASNEYAGGCRLAMQEIGWDVYEPTNGTFSTSYASQQVSLRNALTASGQKITLGMAMHYAPSWINTIANWQYIDQSGTGSGTANFVFNQLIRNRAELYMTRINNDLGLNNYRIIRITSGSNAEVLYPGDGAYWAYDTNAQGGANRPATIQPCPYPDWKPGQTSITIAQVREWAEWYIQSLTDSVNWQMKFLRGLGFTGWFEILTPGMGSRPQQWESDIAARLPDGITGVGAVWHKVYENLYDRRGVIAYVSSVADSSGSDDVTQPGDVAVNFLSNTVTPWSATRYIVRLANEYQIPVGGENPGFGDAAGYTDTSSTGMLAHSFNQLQAGKFFTFYWAHSDRLWDGTLPFSNYQAKIASANSSSYPLPPAPVLT
jgi:hypothetical protein